VGCRFLHDGRRCLPAGGCHLRPFHAPRQIRRPPLSQAGPRPSPKPPATTASSWSTPLAKAAGHRCLKLVHAPRQSRRPPLSTRQLPLFQPGIAVSTLLTASSPWNS
jgi:hypothetical protein